MYFSIGKADKPRYYFLTCIQDFNREHSVFLTYLHVITTSVARINERLSDVRRSTAMHCCCPYRVIEAGVFTAAVLGRHTAVSIRQQAVLTHTRLCAGVRTGHGLVDAGRLTRRPTHRVDLARSTLDGWKVNAATPNCRC